MANSVQYVQSPFNKQRKDKFLLVLNLPDALKTVNSQFNRNNETLNLNSIQFSVYGLTIPEISIPQVDTKYGNQNFAHSSFNRPPWAPATVNFTIDNRFNNYWAIYSWLNMLNDDATGLYDINNLTNRPAQLKNISPQVDTEYKADISVYLLDEYDKRSVQFLFKKAFPTALGGFDVNYRNAEELETTFTFAYSQFIMKLVENVNDL